MKRSPDGTKATIGSGVTTNFDTGIVNRDTEKTVGEWKGTNIENTYLDLGIEYWLTEAGRGAFLDQIDEFKESVQKFKAEVSKVKEKVFNKEKISESETNLYLLGEIINDFSFSEDFGITEDELNTKIEELRISYKEQVGTDFDSLTSDALIGGIIHFSQMLNEENELSEEDSRMAKIQLILAYHSLMKQDKSYEKLANDINAKIFAPIVKDAKFKEISEKWTALYNNNEGGQNNQELKNLYDEYANLFKMKVNAEYNIDLNETEFLLVHNGENSVKLNNGIIFPVPNDLTGAFVSTTNSSIINIGNSIFSDFSTVNKTNKHENGWHNILYNIFNKNTSEMNDIISKFQLQNYQQIYNKTKPSKLMQNEKIRTEEMIFWNQILYLKEAEEAGARYLERLD